jgi:hypothetical protein
MSEDLDLSEVGVDYWLNLLDFKRSQLLGANNVARPRAPWAAVRAKDDAAELALIQARRDREDVDRLVAKNISAAKMANPARYGAMEFVRSDGSPVELGKAVTREDRRAYLAGKSVADFETRDAA